ncbi:unnamed protein product [Phytomonas sp. Hart1]|nr:unnamed protein product [Phytomonas sp. Hart1]|eukprot:CCW66040.1 unnamed protein product [Phytomonas sp. isolate Hart1]
MQFYGTISVGSSAKKFKVLFDTGSGNMWLPTEKTNMCGTKQCYSSRQSTTSTLYTNEYVAKYIGGIVRGVLVKDTVRLGSFTTEQFFAEVNDVSGVGNVYASAKWDGVVGMGWPSIAEYNIRPTIFSLFDANTNLAKQFAFYLPKTPNMDGELVIGGYNTKRFTGDLVPVQLTSQAHWTVAIPSAKIGNNVISKKVTGILDSGSSFISVPQKAFQKILHATSATMKEGVYVVDCETINQLPNFELEIGGNKWIFKGIDYIVRFGDKECVIGMLQENSKLFPDNTWIFGHVFFKHIYTVFDIDQSRVSFAYAK